MWKKLFVVLCWALAVHGFLDGLDNLGDRINAEVAAQVKPLEGLGDRISAQVQQNLKPMQNELAGLGDRISQSVYEGLEPVRAIPLNFKMRDGVGGTTIVTYQPSGQQFIVKNYKMFTCSSQINENTGQCLGTLQRFEITHDSPYSAWCFFRSYSLINDQVCISTGSVSVSVYNGYISCRSNDNRPTLLIPLDQYKQGCSRISQSAEFRYIADENDPAHVAIPNGNRYVKCKNQQKNYCIFNEENGLLNTYSSRSRGIVIVQNGGQGGIYY